MWGMSSIRVFCVSVVVLLSAFVNVSDAQWLMPWSAPIRAQRAIAVEFLNDTAEAVDVFDRQFFKGTVQVGGRLKFLVWEGDVVLFAQREKSKTWHKLVTHHHQDFIWRLNLPQRQIDQRLPIPIPEPARPRPASTGSEGEDMSVAPRRRTTNPIPAMPVTRSKLGNQPVNLPGESSTQVEDSRTEPDQLPQTQFGDREPLSDPNQLTGETIAKTRFYSQMVWCDGIKIQASALVDPTAMTNAQAWVRRMLANCPKVKQQLVEANATIIILGRQQELTDLPENRGLASLFLEPGIRGMSRSNLAFVAEENLLYLDDDKHNGEGVLVHELAHVIEQVVLVGKWHDHLELAFAKAKYGDLWEGRYASSNSHEYFAELSQMYFGVAHTRKTGGINGDLALHRHDREGYELVNAVFSDSIFDMK